MFGTGIEARVGGGVTDKRPAVASAQPAVPIDILTD
jgi:hypothetical protein